MQISVSLLSSYIYCKRKLFLTYVLGFEEPDKAEMAKGSIRHDTYDKINKTEENLVKNITRKIEINELEQKYMLAYSRLLRETIIDNLQRLKNLNINPTETYKQIWPYFITEASSRARNIHSFMEKTNLLGEELWKNLTPKIISELSVASDKLMLKGRIDRIEDYGDYWVPIELKTGSCPREGVWHGHLIQIAAYILLLKENNKQIKEGFIHYLDNNEKRSITLNPFIRDEVIELVKKVNNLLNSAELPEYESENKCGKCAVKFFCHDEKEINRALKQLIQKK